MGPHRAAAHLELSHQERELLTELTNRRWLQAAQLPREHVDDRALEVRYEGLDAAVNEEGLAML